MGSSRKIAAIATVGSNPKSSPGLFIPWIALCSVYVFGKPIALSTGQRFVLWIPLSTFLTSGASSFLFFFSYFFTHSYSCSYSVSGSGSYSLFRFPALPDARSVKSNSSDRLVTSSQFSRV